MDKDPERDDVVHAQRVREEGKKMQRLTEKDNQGNWCLKGVRWEQLHVGQVITREVNEKLYGALCKLKDYEESGGSPDCIVDLIENYVRAMTLLAALTEKHRWIPVEERLPEEDKWVQVVVKRHRWISDFGDKSVPDEEKEDHPEENYATLGKLKKDNTWVYLDLESDDECLWTSVVNDCSQENLSYPMTEVLTWLPLSTLYGREKEANPATSTDWKGHYMDRFEKVK